MKLNRKDILYHTKLMAACSLSISRAIPIKIRPTVMNLKLTENCNSKCVTCGYWRSNHPIGLCIERILKLLEEMRDLKIKCIRFTGGEPLLRKDFFDILSSIKKGDFEKVCLATNGLLLPKFAKKINDSVITNISVSLDAIGEKNDKLRGIDGYFSTAMKGLSMVNKRRKVVSTLTSALIPDLEDLIHICQKKGYAFDINLPDYRMYFFSSSEVKKTIENLWPDSNEVDRAMAILNKYGIINKRLEQYARYYLKNRRVNFVHCMIGLVEANIDSDGELRTGCNVFKTVGNVNKASLAEILCSVKYIKSVRKMYELKCPGCVCGYAVSVTYKHPFSSLGYIKKRLGG